MRLDARLGSAARAPLNFASAKYGAFWYPALDSLQVPTFISATNNSAVQRDNLRTFAAGALLGIGGGALVGAIQEAFHVHVHEGELRQPVQPVAPEKSGDTADEAGDEPEEPGDATEEKG